MGNIEGVPVQPEGDASFGTDGTGNGKASGPLGFVRAHPWRAGLAAVLVLVLLISWCTGGGGSAQDYAAELPKDTIGFMAATNLDVVHETLTNSGMLNVIAGHMEDELFRSFMEKTQAVRISYHEPTGGAREDNPIAILTIVEMDEDADPEELLPAEDLQEFERKETDAGVVLIGSNAYGGQAAHICGQGKNLCISTDADILDRYLRGDLADEGSLADSDGFGDAMSGMPDGDLTIYVSAPQVVEMVRKIFLAGGSADRQAMLAAENLGVGSLRAGVIVANYDGSLYKARLVVNEDNAIYRVLEQPTTSFGITRYIPDNTGAFVLANTGDSKETLKGILDVAMRIATGMGAAKDESEFNGMVQALEKEIGVTFSDLAGSLDGEIGFFVPNCLDGEGFTFCATVKDADDTQSILMGLGKTKDELPIRENTVGKHTVYTLGEDWEMLSWVFIDDNLFISESREALTTVCETADNGGSLGDLDRFKAMAGKLPSKSSMQLFMNVGQQMQALTGASPQKELPLVGISVTVEDGKIDLELACDKDFGLKEALARVMGAETMSKSNESVKRSESRGNMHNVGVALQMYADDHDGEWPDSLEVLRDGRYLNDPEYLTSPVTGEMYKYKKPGPSAGDRTPVLWEDPGEGDAFNVLYYDGAAIMVRRHGEDAYEAARKARGGD